MKIIREAKLYPNKTQESILNELFSDSRLFYNAVLERKISYYKETGENLSRSDLQKEFKTQFKEIPATLRQTIIYRVNIAFQNFHKHKRGFPRFKKQRRYRSIELRQYGQDYRVVEGKLKIWGKVGSMRMRGYTLEPCGMGRIVKRAAGYYLQYPVEIEGKTPVKIKKKIGIDVGLKYFLADNTGNIVENPKLFRKSEHALAKKQRILSKAKRDSNRRKKRLNAVAKLYEKIANQRKDFLHKVSRKYVENYDFIAVEDLNVNGMVKNVHLSKSIHDASWSMFFNMLDYKSKILGRTFVRVAPHYTSQKCICGAYVPKSLSVRTHICPECGIVEDRDVMSAKLILKKAWNTPSARKAQ